MKTQTQERLYYVGMKNIKTNTIHGIWDNNDSFYYPNLVLHKTSYTSMFSLEDVKKAYENALVFLERIKKENYETFSIKNGMKVHKKIKGYCDRGNVRLFIGKVKKIKSKKEELTYGNEKIRD
jgi:hypothetical protein